MNEFEAAAWLSDARSAPFLDSVGGDHDKAVELYEWNARLGSACFTSIHHFEVLLRNAIDAQLGAGQPQTPVYETWLYDFTILRSNGIKKVMDAAGYLEGQNKQLSRGRIVAAVSFGFWTGLVGKEYDELWRQQLRQAFPHQNDLQIKHLRAPLKEIQRLRNRVAHHECLLDSPVEKQIADMIRIASYIDPRAARWIEAQDRTLEALAQRPG